MKVLLVYPPHHRSIPSILPGGVEESRGAFPPLGILYLAAAIRDMPSVNVTVMDAAVEDLSAVDIARFVAERDVDLLCMTVLSFELLDALEVASLVKAKRPATRIAVGGPHPHLYPQETLALGPFDYAARGEGESVLPELINRLMKGGDPSGIDGLVPKDSNKYLDTCARPEEDLDRLPVPARDLLNVNSYYSVLSGLRPITTMMSSRGCPYKCIFCDRPHLGKAFRKRSAAGVVEEMAGCRELGIREVVFYDDNFSMDRERVRAIAELLLESRLNLAWDIRARVGDLDRETLRLCAKAGLARIHFGVESGDEEMLRVLKKGISTRQVVESFKLAREAGIERLAYFMVGLPGETVESLQRSIDLALTIDPDFVHFSVLIPFPGTPVYEMALERGIIGSDVWREFAKNPRPDFIPPLWQEHLSREEIQRALRTVYRRFYGRPSYILRRLSRARSLSGILSSARMGYRILFMKGR